MKKVHATLIEIEHPVYKGIIWFHSKFNDPLLKENMMVFQEKTLRRKVVQFCTQLYFTLLEKEDVL